MNIWQAILLGAIQGVTEWLPVSSSGHLVIAEQLLGLSSPLSFAILLHFATLLVLCTIYWNDLKEMSIAVFRWNRSSEYFRLAQFIFLGSIPTAIIGFSFKGLFEQLFSNLFAVAVALLFTGTLLFLTKLTFVHQREGKSTLNSFSSLLIGTVQAIAIIPGISRSGITISSGLFYGVNRETVARYSFLLSIPAILGATLFEGLTVFSTISGASLLPLFFGMSSAYVVGYFSLRWLLHAIKMDKFYLCAYYCFALGITLLLLLYF